MSSTRSQRRPPKTQNALAANSRGTPQEDVAQASAPRDLAGSRAGNPQAGKSPADKAATETADGESHLVETSFDAADAPIGEDGLQRRRWTLKRTLPGRRLDRYLADRLSHLSRTAISRLIREGLVTINGRPTKPSHEPSAGDVIDVAAPPHIEHDLIAEVMALDILHEDQHLLVLNKPAGIAVHPARGQWTGTLVNGLLGHVQSLSNYHADKLRPGVVHRLDKNTTGVMAFAKTEEAHWRLAVQWENRQVSKEYLALVEGCPSLQSDWIDAPIGKHPTQREKYAVRPDQGRSCLTFVETRERFVGFALVRCQLHTGRTHQIRVHLAHIGHPVLTDDVYGHRSQLWGSDVRPRLRLVTAQPPHEGMASELVEDRLLIARQALHAWRLGLRHPITGEAMTFEAPLPTDMAATLEALRRHRALS